MDGQRGLKATCEGNAPAEWHAHHEDVESRCLSMAEARCPPFSACGEFFSTGTKHRCTVLWQIAFMQKPRRKVIPCLLHTPRLPNVPSMALSPEQILQAEIAGFSQHFTRETKARDPLRVPDTIKEAGRIGGRAQATRVHEAEHAALARVALRHEDELSQGRYEKEFLISGCGAARHFELPIQSFGRENS